MTSQDDHDLVLGTDGRRLDRIELRGLAAVGRHGVHDHERRDGQRFVADVVVHLDTRRAAAGDDLVQTVDYGVLARQVVAVLAGEPVDLLETLAERIAATALADPQVQAVDVSVHKPQAPLPLEFTDVVVSIRRDRTRLPAAEPYDAVVPVEAPPADEPVDAEPLADLPPADDSLVSESLAEALPSAPVLVAGAPIGGAAGVGPLAVPAPAFPVEVAPSVDLASSTQAVAPEAVSAWSEPAAPLEAPAPEADAPADLAPTPHDAPVEAQVEEPAPAVAVGEVEPLPASVDWIPDPEPVAASSVPTPPWPRRDGADQAEPVAEAFVEPVEVPEPAVPVASQVGDEQVTPDLAGPEPLAPVVGASEPVPPTPAPPALSAAPAAAPAALAVVEPLPPTFAPSAPPSPPHADAPAIVVRATPAADPEVVPAAPHPPLPPVTEDDDAVLDRLPSHLVDVVIALGGNVGPVLDTLRWAVQRLRAVPGLEVTAVGPLARTAAVGVTDQPDFLNTVVLARCLLPPRELLHRLRAVEQEAGRERHERWGPRTLDLDLIVYGTLSVVTDELELPHPRAHERAFVLQPWAAVDPGAVLPGLGGGPVGALAATAPDVAGLSWVPGDWLAPDGSQAP